MELDRNGRLLLWAAFLGYLGLFAYTVMTGDPTAQFALDLVFVAIMFAFSWFAYRQFGGEQLGMLTASALAGAGVAELIALFTTVTIAGVAGDILLIAGLILYIYLRRGR